MPETLDPTQAQRDLASDICFTVAEHPTERDRDVMARMIAEYLKTNGAERKEVA